MKTVYDFKNNFGRDCCIEEEFGQEDRVLSSTLQGGGQVFSFPEACSWNNNTKRSFSDTYSLVEVDGTF